MIMQRADFDTAVQQLLHDGFNLFLRQNEIAHHHGVLSHRFERNPGTQCKPGLQRDTIQRDIEVRARHADAVDAARHFRTALAQRLCNGFPLRICCRGAGSGYQKRDHACRAKQVAEFMHYLPPWISAERAEYALRSKRTDRLNDTSVSYQIATRTDLSSAKYESVVGHFSGSCICRPCGVATWSNVTGKCVTATIGCQANNLPADT